MTDESLIQNALAALGDNPNDVAHRLLDLGMFGHRGANCGCPIALYCCQVLAGRVEPPRVGPRGVIEFTLFTGLDWVYVTMEAPRPVQQFVRCFDAGKYPFLEGELVDDGLELPAEVPA